MGIGKKLVVGGVIAVGAIGIIGILAVILILGYLGFMPGVSDLMGTNKPIELGVKFSEANYAAGLAKVPGAQVLNPEALCITCPYTSTGSVPVNTSFSNEEFTAMVNKRNSTKGPLRDAQVKFNADGTFETSGKINDPRVTGPVYVKAKIESVSGKSVQIQIDSAKMGNLPIPDDQLPIVQDIAEKAIADTFAKNPGLNITSLSIEDGQIKFDGTLPETVTGDPNVIPEEYQ